MANPYPIEVQAGDAEGPIVVGGLATFTDPDNQPGGGGGLPTGWTQDGDPADVATNGGKLDLSASGDSAGRVTIDNQTAITQIRADRVQVGTDATNEQYEMAIGRGITSAPPEDVPAFTADPSVGATVALDAGGLDIANAGDVDGETLGPTFDYVTVQAAPPTTYLTPLVQDTTAVSGGVYAWDGSAYQKISSV